MKNHFLNRKAIHCLVLTVSCVVLVFLIFGFLSEKMSWNAETTAVALLWLSSMAVLNVCTWRIVENVFDRVSRQKEADRQKQQMENIIRLSLHTQEHRERVFKIQHDLKNHLSVVHSMLLDGNSEQAREYIRELRLSLPAKDTENGD